MIVYSAALLCILYAVVCISVTHRLLELISMSVLPQTKIQHKKNTQRGMKHKFRYHGFQQKLISRVDFSVILCVPSLKALQLVEQK